MTAPSNSLVLKSETIQRLSPLEVVSDQNVVAIPKLGGGGDVAMSVVTHSSIWDCHCSTTCPAPRFTQGKVCKIEPMPCDWV